MDLKASLINDQSKENAVRISDWIGDDQLRMAQLMELFFSGGSRMTQRAAYPLIYISDRNTDLFKPYLEKMIDFMSDEVHDAVIRNSHRLFQSISFPEELEGKLYDKCINYLRSPKYAVAIRVFSMTVLANLCKKYPDLVIEVLPLIEDILEITESAGMKSRGKKTIKILKDLI